MPYYEDASITHDVTTEANWRAWAQKVHDAIAAVGLVQTSDTGQITISSATMPGTSAFATGYEMWRFDDAAQSTDPIFLKLEYGKGSAATRPALRCQWGTGSNGSGTLTNANAAAQTASATGTPTTGRIYASFADGVFALCVSPAQTGTSMFIATERLRGISDGELISGDWYTLIFYGSGFSSLNMYIRSGGAWTQATHSSVESSVAASGVVAVGYMRVTSVKPHAPLRCFLGMRAAIIGADDAGDITIDGVGKQYKRLNITETTTWGGGLLSHGVLVPNEA
jgi:hypothetical protein